jgi:heat shock protein HtpX
MGYIRTFILMAALTALFMAVGAAVAGRGGAEMAFLVALAMNLFAFWNSDKMVLATYRAKPADETVSPGLVGLVGQLAGNAGLPTPKVYVYESDQPNAFATGRSPSHAAVAVSTGLLRRLGMAEIAGVLAHEIAHIKHRDTLTMTMTATLAGAVSFLANMAMWVGVRDSEGRRNPLGGLLVMIFAPLAAGLVQMAISRSREFEADRLGAGICGRPLWLAEALEKLESSARAIPDMTAQTHPATAHMFIVNPLAMGGITNLFRSHPPTEERVRRLREMAAQGPANA